MQSFKIQFIANGKRQEWIQFYHSFAQALKCGAESVRREFGSETEIVDIARCADPRRPADGDALLLIEPEVVR